jgi:hypothetical protein
MAILRDQRMLHHEGASIDDIDFDLEHNNDFETLSNLAVKLIKRFETLSNFSISIVIDAVNQLDTTDLATLKWLPKPLPANVRVLVSCISPSPSLELLRSAGVHEIPIDELTEYDRKDIITESLAEYRKSLNVGQQQMLLGKAGSSSPLYLTLACEELRIFGIYEV